MGKGRVEAGLQRVDTTAAAELAAATERLLEAWGPRATFATGMTAAKLERMRRVTGGYHPR